MEEFARIKRLPPYVFNITGELKAAARKRGEDVIDLSMGNPDQPTPRHIVDKLIESVRRPDTHRCAPAVGPSQNLQRAYLQAALVAKAGIAFIPAIAESHAVVHAAAESPFFQQAPLAP